MNFLKSIKLSKRLHKASEYIVSGHPLIDVGSDHAYLPIHLLQRGVVPSAIAGEITEGPLAHAQEKIEYYRLTDQISARLGSGLDVLDDSDQIGTITICGMGGSLIADILDKGLQNGKLPHGARLVLQPNNTEVDLREWLANNHYQIIDEAIVKEGKKFYEIIVAEYRNKAIHISEEELIFGPKLMEKQPEMFLKKWQEILEKNRNVLELLTKIKKERRLAEVREQIQQIEKVIS